MINPTIIIPNGSMSLVYGDYEHTLDRPIAVAGIESAPPKMCPDRIHERIDSCGFHITFEQSGGYIPDTDIDQIIPFTGDVSDGPPEPLSPAAYRDREAAPPQQD